MASEVEEEKLKRFLHWLQVNKVELRGCNIKYCDRTKGFGVFSTNQPTDGVLLVVPLELAITPMRVLQDPLIGPECRAMFEEGEVDDRFLMILFLMLHHLRKNSTWKPYLDVLPTTFGTPYWFDEDELLELRGTTLYRATQLQKKSLHSLYKDKVKDLMKKLLIVDGDLETEVSFEDFLWANSIFWTRALSIPLPRSYVFPEVREDEICHSSADIISEISQSAYTDQNSVKNQERVKVHGTDDKVNGVPSISVQEETICVEGLVPGIDFCNHDLRAVATWEVDATGSRTGLPFSMYLLSALQTSVESEKEISISYGNKGNEELLFLYGFVIDKNPDDYLMVHYPVEAIQDAPFSESKLQLLEAQKAELRCLLPKCLLDQGFFSSCTQNCDGKDKCEANKVCSFSWSGRRKMPSYVNKLVFPDDFLTSLRTIAMREEELYKVSSLLEELEGPEGERQPTDKEVRAAVWEACGDSGAFQALVDLLQSRIMDLEEYSGTEDCDSELLAKVRDAKSAEQQSDQARDSREPKWMSKNRWSSIVYRRGQKELTRLFLKEAEHALQLSLSEGN